MWREAGRGMDYFLLWHPGGGTTTSDFHFRGKTQGSLSYGHDNKRCFTAHDALCLSICSTSMIILSLSACLTDVFSLLLADRGVCLPIYLLYGELVCLSACPHVILYPVFLSVRGWRSTIQLRLPSTTCLNNRCSVSWPMWSFTRSFLLLFWTSTVHLCIPSLVAVLNASELPVHSSGH